MQYLFRTLKTVLLCTLFLILFSQVSSAKVLTFEESGDQFIANLDMVTFINSNGLFDGTTNYAEITSSLMNHTNNLECTIHHVIDLQKPYIKLYKMDFKDTSSESIEERTVTTNSKWKNMVEDKASHNYELYQEVLKHVNQNWKSVYDLSVKQAERSALNLSWNGSWRTLGATIQITQNNDTVECIINDKKLIGKLSGNVVTGKWSGMKFFSSTEPKGDFRLIMSPDGKSIKIQWQDNIISWVTNSTADRIN